MRWQRVAQFAIAISVVVFIVILVMAMRREKPAPEQRISLPPLPGKDVQLVNQGGGRQSWFSNGRKVFDAEFGKHVALADGRNLLSEHVRIVTERNGKLLTINTNSADIMQKGGEFETADLKGSVQLTGEGGLDVRSEEATYVEREGIVRMPGPVEFRKGRLRGNGVGATYDMNREVLWLLEKATFNVSADKNGKGALAGSADAVGLARLEHYLRLTKRAQIDGDGREIRADEITVMMTEDDERVRTLQLRGNSTVRGGAGGPQSMSARDIDVTYGDDGVTLQNANLMENAVLQLAHSTGSGQADSGKRVSGKVINLAMAPDGKTVTHLTSSENAQVDLPAENNAPAKRIRAATLVADGTAETGLKSAQFTGNVEYRETPTPGRRGAPTPAERTARSESLLVETKPGLGAIEKADFRGRVRFIEGDMTAEAPRAIYHVERDRLELMPSDDKGLPPQVKDTRMTVSARTIDFTIGTRDMMADTQVSSTLTTKPGARTQQSKLPSVMKQNEPVNVTANRMQYQGGASKAIYSGNVKMWQEKESATIKGDTLTLDDKTGNLEATGNVITNFLLDEADAKTKEKKRTPTIGKSQRFVFDDKQRLATYTGNAQFDGAQGNLTAEKIEVFLKSGENQVERLEAYAQGKIVTVKEGRRTVTGTHLTYTAADEKYLMVGVPVTGKEEDEKKPGWCQFLEGASLEFYRGAETGQMKGTEGTNTRSRTWSDSCSSAKR